MDPFVSICCITYNHEPYIRQCVEGFLMQKTDFAFEILIHDDASTDQTAAIIREYEMKHPGIINAIYQKENQFSQGVRSINPRFNFSRAKGANIAICDGDDYWTDPYKLQKQIDFLKENAEYSMCFHDVDVLHETNIDEQNQPKKRIPPNQTEFSFDDLLSLGNFIYTPSVVFRNLFGDYELVQSLTGDYFMNLHISSKGKIKRLLHKMAVYRVHDEGVFTQRFEWTPAQRKVFYDKQIETYHSVMKTYCQTGDRKRTVGIKLWNLHFILRFYHIESGEYYMSRQISWYLLKRIQYCKPFSLKKTVSVIVNLMFPRMLKDKSQGDENEKTYRF